VLGIVLPLGVGYLWLAQVGTGIGRSLDWPSRLTALLYGVGAALTLDEFALWPPGGRVLGARRAREHRRRDSLRALLGVGRGACPFGPEPAAGARRGLLDVALIAALLATLAAGLFTGCRTLHHVR
jgi:hypothetical protein